MPTTTTPNMNLVLPIPGEEPGPEYATDNNAAFTQVDQHNHTAGFGALVPTAGLNINADLAFQGTNPYQINAAIFNNNTVPLTGTPYLSCIFVSGGNLYYNNSAGVNVQITSGSSVNAGAGSITGLPSGTASVTFSSGVYVFQSATSTPATIDVGSAILRNTTPSAFGVTLSPVNALAADYTLVMPQIPSVQNIMTLDNAGNITAPWNVDGSTIVVAANTIKVPTGGITATQLEASIRPPAGIINAYGGTSAPTGWLMCDGTSYLRATFPDLFTAIGTAYGSADGTHFNVPDLRGRFLRSTDNGAGRDPDASSRTAMNTGGNTGDNVGSVQGFAEQDHYHNVVQNAGATGALSSSNFLSISVAGGGTLQGTTTQNAVGKSSTVSSATVSTETRPINAYCNFIIKT